MSARTFYTVWVTWGEKGSENRRYMRMLLTAKQYALSQKREAYRRYLEFECNVQQCDLIGKNYQAYDAIIAVDGSPMHKTIEKEFLQAGKDPDRQFTIVDMTRPEYQCYEIRYPARG